MGQQWGFDCGGEGGEGVVWGWEMGDGVEEGQRLRWVSVRCLALRFVSVGELNRWQNGWMNGCGWI